MKKAELYIKLLEKITKKKVVLKEENYSLTQTYEITKIVKGLLSNGVDQKKIQSVLDFYKYKENVPFEIEDKIIFDEFKNHLKSLK